MIEQETPKLIGFRLNEWANVQSRAKAQWMKTVLGEKPTFAEVRKTRHNPHSVSALEWLAFAVLVVLTVWTSYKVGALAVPFATNTLETLTEHTTIAEPVRLSFILVTALLFMLLATPSVIYFKLLSSEKQVEIDKKATQSMKWYMRWTLKYLTPRLPAIVVYLSVAWLFYLSSQLPGTPFEQYLPVIIEVALAALVGNILEKRKQFNQLVSDALQERLRPYELALKNYATQGSYLRVLYQVMREEVVQLQRLDAVARRNVRPNAWVEQAPEHLVYQLMSAEFKRLMTGDQFATEVLSDTQPVVPISPEFLELKGVEAKRVPPDGSVLWTQDTLLHDLRMRDVPSTYSELDLNRDYEPKHGAREAWRAGVKKHYAK